MSKHGSFSLARLVFSRILFDPCARLTTRIRDILGVALDQGHAWTVLPLIFGLLDDWRLDEFLRRVEVDCCLISGAFAASSERRVGKWCI